MLSITTHTLIHPTLRFAANPVLVTRCTAQHTSITLTLVNNTRYNNCLLLDAQHAKCKHCPCHKNNSQSTPPHLQQIVRLSYPPPLTVSLFPLQSCKNTKHTRARSQPCTHIQTHMCCSQHPTNRTACQGWRRHHTHMRAASCSAHLPQPQCSTHWLAGCCHNAVSLSVS